MADLKELREYEKSRMLQAGKSLTLTELRRDLKKLGFKVLIKRMSWGPHAVFKNKQNDEMPSMFTDATLAEWKPLIDYLKGVDEVTDKGDKVYGAKKGSKKVAGNQKTTTSDEYKAMTAAMKEIGKQFKLLYTKAARKRYVQGDFDDISKDGLVALAQLKEALQDYVKYVVEW